MRAPPHDWFVVAGLDKSRITVNISGHMYETRVETLQRFPNTLLGNRHKRMAYYIAHLDEYFFQRSRIFFDAILFFYQSGGILQCPIGLPYELFVEECRFFQLSEDVIEKAKPKNFKCVGNTEVSEENLYERQTFREKIWDVLQNPRTSLLAQWFSIVSLFAVVLSVLSSSLQSVPELNVVTQVYEENPWSCFELALNTFFLFELVLGVLSAPDTFKFFQSSMTWIDIAAVLPYFLMLLISKEKLGSFKFLRILRMIRIGRMFRFSKHSKRIALVGKILVSCVGDLKTLLLCVVMIVVLAGSLMYHLEEDMDKGEGFTTIPVGVYWAIQTLFTIGYGDIVPTTNGGKLFAGMFMMFGASSICIPLLSIIAKFQENWDDGTTEENRVYYKPPKMQQSSRGGISLGSSKRK